MNGNDMIDARDDRDCDNGYAWWWECVGQYQDEQAKAAERNDANTLLWMIAGDDDK